MVAGRDVSQVSKNPRSIAALMTAGFRATSVGTGAEADEGGAAASSGGGDDGGTGEDELSRRRCFDGCAEVGTNYQRNV